MGQKRGIKRGIQSLIAAFKNTEFEVNLVIDAKFFLLVVAVISSQETLR